MIRHQRFFFIVLTGMVLLLSACGPKSTRLNVEMTDFKFNPNSFSVPAGVTVSLTMKNSGALEHSFIIMKAGSKASVPFSKQDLANIYFEKKVPAGETSTAEFTAPSEPGTYEVVCDIAGHLEQGMTATLTVTK